MAVSFPEPLLKISNTPSFNQFLHDCIDDLTGLKQARFDSYNSDIEWTNEDFQQAKMAIQKFYRENISQEKYEPIANLDTKIQNDLQNCFEIRKSDIADAVVRESFVKSGHNLVENFDWKLKWILGCSQLSSVREPKLQVDLHCIDDCKKYTVNFELDAKRLDDFIEQLEGVFKEIKSVG